MKKIFIIQAYVMLLLLTTFAVPANAQNSTSESDHHFYFIYIAPDRSVDKKVLREELNKTVEAIVKNEDPAILYLANGTQPVIVKFNIGENNQGDYTDKLDYMVNNNTSWKLDAPGDVTHIQELLRNNNFLNAEGQLIYRVTEFDFHVGKSFWDQKCNESLIGKLYFELNAAKYMGNPSFRYNVFFYCPPAQDNYDNENKFGILNPDGINQNVAIQRKQTL